MEDVSGEVEFGDWHTVRARLRTLREDGGRESWEVITLGERLLREYGGKLGNEAWDVQEQVLLAALDVANLTLAEKCLVTLERQFPGSVRVCRLRGMLLEASGDLKQALELYDDLLNTDPGNSMVHKRKVAVYKAKNDLPRAIAELNDIVKLFMADYEAWMELADLYINQHSYEKAMFCLEELILSNPHHHLYHQRYADACYSCGGLENLELARKHYSASLKLNPNSLRSLYGLHQAAVALACHPKHKSKAEVRVRNNKMADWARDQLQHLYQGHKCFRVVERFLDSTRS